MTEATADRPHLTLGVRAEPAPERPRGWLRFVPGRAIFWGWNGLFLAVCALGLGPTYAWSLVEEAARGLVPVELALCAFAFVVVPVLGVVLGYRLRRDPRALLELFYGVEVPILLLVLLRVFFLRELTPATGLVLATAVVAGAAFAWGLAGRASPRLLALRLPLHAVGLAVALYVAALLAFFAVPVGVALARGFFAFTWLRDLGALVVRDLYALLFAGLALSLFLLTATLFAALPVALVALYVGRWRDTFAVFAARWGRAPAAAITAAVLASLSAGFARVNVQPQRAVLARLATPPATDAERRARVADAPAIRAALLGAYLAPYRYVSPRGTSHVIAHLYGEQLQLDEAAARAVEDAFEGLAAPLFYDGDALGPDERRTAAERYAEVFGVSIQRGEQPAILAALASTYERSEREAGLLDEGGRKVRVVRQELRVDEHGPVAEVELHEVYESQSPEPEELVYFFSLPESAAITGLWLGPSADRAARSAFVVAPRGAAQAVYRAEVQRRVDPALVEQLGPRQYRLRAFPVPARTRPGLGADAVAPPLHLWLTFTVLADDGAWPLPALAERRNVYFDGDTELVVNGVPRARPCAACWLPTSLPVTALDEAAAAPIRAEVGPGLVVRVEPAPRAERLPAAGGAYAVVIDRSFGMAKDAAALEGALAWLEDRVVPRADVDLYLSSSLGRGEPALRLDEPRGFDPRGLVYYGGTSFGALRRDFEGLRGTKRYDAVIVLTGAERLERDEDRTRDAGVAWDAPLWMVHVGGALPKGYDDRTTELLQRTGGGATTELPRVFAELARREAGAGEAGEVIAVDGGWRFTLERTRGPAAEGGEGEGAARATRVADDVGARALRPLAARVVVQAKTRGADPSRLGVLDEVHAIARAHAVVTPYSSMLVLVEDRQREALAAAEAASDRFEREVETGEEALSTPKLGGFGGVLTATPEPEEWLLFAVALGLLAAGFHRRVAPPSPT